MLSTAARAYARCWPALLAWFLAGWTARLLLLRFAAAVGNDIPLVGQLILPLAVIARLASYVAMFLVLRAALPNVIAADPPRADGSRMSFLARWGAAISAAILPFFLIYTAWGMVAEDGRDYAAASLDQADLFGGEGADALDVVVDAWSLGIVAIAFVGRWLLQRFDERLPRWTSVVAAYLEAVWVLVALLVLRELLGGLPGWFATRRMFAPLVDTVELWRREQPWFAWLGDAASWLATQLGDVIFQPLAWIALAAVVYAGARTRREAAAPNARVARARAAVTARWTRMPTWTRKLIVSVTGGFQERWLPIAGSVRLIWSAGPLTLATFLLAYAVVHAAGEWIGFGVMRLFGPHETTFWMAIDDPVGLLVVALVVPVQLALVGGAYDTALARSAPLAEEAITPAAGGTPAEAPRG